jgi:hypothetical protein
MPAQSPIPLYPVPSSLALAGVKILKSASTKVALVTNQALTCGLLKLDGVIAYPEEITNLRLPFGAVQAALQLLHARYGCLCSVRKINR